VQVAKKKSDGLKVKADCDIAMQIVIDAHIRRGAFSPQTAEEESQRAGAELQRVYEFIQTKEFKEKEWEERIKNLFSAAETLFAEISENHSLELAVRIFQSLSKRARGKAYNRAIEKALCFHVEVTGSSYKTAKFAHETYRVGNSIAALQKHIQRLLKSDDKKFESKCRDK
jgi:hypothetical protein